MFGLFTGLLSVTPTIKDVAGAVVAVATALTAVVTAATAIVDAVQNATEPDRA